MKTLIHASCLCLILAAAATPRNVVATLNAGIRKALESPQVAAGFEKVGAEPLGNSSQDAAVYVRNEFSKWAKVVRDAKLRTE